MNTETGSAGVGVDIENVASEFVSARLAGHAITAYPGTVPPDLAAAYRCQDAAIDRWPEPVGGWKVARIAAAARLADPRLIGPAFPRNLRTASPADVVVCPVFKGGFAAVEAEVVIRVGKDAPADKLEWTIDEAREFVGSVHIGVEIASSPLPTLNDLGPLAVISDFGNNWGIVVGAEISSWRELETVAAETFIDGVSVGNGVTPFANGPLGALAFTLSNAAERRRPLRAGATITTGMITGVHPIRPGQQSRHVFAGLGEVNIRIAIAHAIV
jgi:2-keto-4-pentenoate hydratase